MENKDGIAGFRRIYGNASGRNIVARLYGEADWIRQHIGVGGVDGTEVGPEEREERRLLVARFLDRVATAISALDERRWIDPLVHLHSDWAKWLSYDSGKIAEQRARVIDLAAIGSESSSDGSSPGGVDQEKNFGELLTLLRAAQPVVGLKIVNLFDHETDRANPQLFELQNGIRQLFGRGRFVNCEFEGCVFGNVAYGGDQPPGQLTQVRGGQLIHSAFYGCDWSSTRWPGLQALGVKFTSANRWGERMVAEDVAFDGGSFSDVLFGSFEAGDFSAKQGTFSECAFRTSVLRDSHFDDSVFSLCVFDGVGLDRCSFQGATFHGCRFENVLIREGDFRGATFVECDFSGMEIVEGLTTQELPDFSKTHFADSCTNLPEQFYRLLSDKVFSAQFANSNLIGGEGAASRVSPWSWASAEGRPKELNVGWTELSNAKELEKVERPALGHSQTRPELPTADQVQH